MKIKLLITLCFFLSFSGYGVPQDKDLVFIEREKIGIYWEHDYETNGGESIAFSQLFFDIKFVSLSDLSFQKEIEFNWQPKLSEITEDTIKYINEGDVEIPAGKYRCYVRAKRIKDDFIYSEWTISSVFYILSGRPKKIEFVLIKKIK